MRNLKELFSLMIENKHLFGTGLCQLSNKLRRDSIINFKEEQALIIYIDFNKPGRFSKHYSKEQKISAYYWPMFEWEPRDKWIKAQIKKLK